MNDLISRKEMLRAVDSLGEDYISYYKLLMLICRLPSAESERTAKVIHKPEAFFYRCECGYGLCCEKNDMNFCPNCGGRLEWDG